MLSCFLLVGCPPGHFRAYTYIGDTIPSDDLFYTKIEIDKHTTIYTKAGYYHQFIENKETGLAVVVKVTSKKTWNPDTYVKKVYSTLYGDFTKRDSLPYTMRVYNDTNTVLFDLPLPRQNETKTIKEIEGDTISIEFQNNEKIYFVRKQII